MRRACVPTDRLGWPSECWFWRPLILWSISGHWPALRDAVNILDKANWGQFAIFSLVLWMVTLVMVPAMMLGVAYLGKRLARITQSPWR